MEEPKPIAVTARADGGLNLSDTARHIGANESPDMENLWRHDGVLRLRPGLRKLVEQGFGRIIDVYPRDGHSLLIRKILQDGETIEEKRGIYIAAQKGVLCYDGETIEQIADTLTYDNGWKSGFNDYNFDQCVFVPSGSANQSSFSDGDSTWAVNGDTVYLIGCGIFLLISPQVVVYENPTAVPHITAASLSKSIEPYIPTLFEDCDTDGTGTKVEEHNILTGECIQKFTTKNTVSAYKLFDKDIDNTAVSAVYSDGTGSTYYFNFGKDCIITLAGDMIAQLDRSAGVLHFSKMLVSAKTFEIKNNLVVSYSKAVYECSPLNSCSIGIWYDGGTQTAAGYSRMFLSGFEGAPNRIYYSSANNPAYFAQSDFIEVGTPADPITAFGIQYDILAVFKKSSIYSLSYSGSSDTANFTIKEINSSVGCDMPATLRLCSNVLIWGSSAGGIYALQSTSIKDERAVRLVSKNINPMLFAIDQKKLQGASAVCDGTDYFLLVENSAFVLNYELMHFSSGDNPEGIAWFYWSLPQKFSGVFRYGSQFAVSDSDGTVFLLDNAAAEDCGDFFGAHWYSKSFDFDIPDKFKKLYRFMLTIGCNETVKLEICYGDDSYENSQTVTVGGTGEREDAGVGEGAKEKALAFSPSVPWSRNASIGIKRVEGQMTPFSFIEFTLNAVCGAQIR